MKFYLSEIKSREDLKELFIEKWNWESPRISDSFFDFSNEVRDKIGACSVLGEKLNYKLFFFNLNNLEQPEKELKPIERKIITESELKRLVENSVFIFSTNDFEYLDFVKAENVGGSIRIKRFSISPENRDRSRTPCEQLEKLKIEPKRVSPSYIKNQTEEAFSVEAITERFYKEYIEVFEKVKKSLVKQRVEIHEGKKEEKLRDFIHQILNRIMFLYFVQKKGCFGEDKNFLANFWDTYKNKFNGENKFHKSWLNVLFFEALCLPSFQKRYFPEEKSYLKEFVSILINAPYLNGGLFEKNALDEIGWEISDELFNDIFEFFEGYNFTIEESTPFEIEIAINPEMLGNIYEQLVNIEEREEQARAGIFYTPKVEIELMIKRSVVEFLFNKTKINKEKLYEFTFPEKEKEIEDPFTPEEAKKILKELDEVFILDPACGSGHYLVVALQIIYKLKRILWEKLKITYLNKYEEKKKILERNIYGNDIKEWAVNVAKLRLWLDLFVDAEEEVLENQMEPLLPNLSFKIRCGDSLVQRIGREIIPLRKIKSFVGSRRDDLKNLIQKKEYVYKTSDPKEYKNTLYFEKKLLWNALDEYKIKTQKKIQETNSQLKRIQFNLFGDNTEDKQKTLFEKELRKEIESLKATLSDITKFEEELRKQKEPPMLWDLAFAEVFQIKNGFDIVIANPPYVRQERIEDLNDFYSKEEYKEKLIEQTIKDWSYNFEVQPIISPIKKFDRKSDLYVYFYLKGLRLLNPEGVLCYISSNSWLDVGYGAKMQEILLKRVPVVAIYDNQVKRSFKHADVNTIIAVFEAPKMKDFDQDLKKNEVQFVMFKKPFEEIMYSEIFIDLEKGEDLKQLLEGKRGENEIYRLHFVNQKDLYQFGRDTKTGLYSGNKWGRKYLGAPEIFFNILERGKGKLVKLGDITEIEGYIHGNNIGKNYPKAYFVEGIEQVETIYLDEQSLGVHLYGIRNEGNSRKLADLLFPRMIGNRFMVLVNYGKVYGQKFYKIILNDKKIKNILGMFLSSTFQMLQNEVVMLSPWGLGALSVNSFDVKQIYVITDLPPEKDLWKQFLKRPIKSIFTELGFDPSKPIREQEPNPLPDRKALDDIVFDALGLTKEERKEVYWAVAELVQNRLQKAKSV